MFLVNIRTNLITTEFALGFPAGPDDKESACNAGNPGLIPGSGRSPEGDPPVFLPGEFHGQRSLAGYTPWGHKELDMTEQLTLHYYYYLTRNARRVPQAETKRCLLVT